MQWEQSILVSVKNKQNESQLAGKQTYQCNEIYKTFRQLFAGNVITNREKYLATYKKIEIIKEKQNKDTEIEL